MRSASSLAIACADAASKLERPPTPISSPVAPRQPQPDVNEVPQASQDAQRSNGDTANADSPVSASSAAPALLLPCVGNDFGLPYSSPTRVPLTMSNLQRSLLHPPDAVEHAFPSADHIGHPMLLSGAGTGDALLQAFLPIQSGSTLPFAAPWIVPDPMPLGLKALRGGQVTLTPALDPEESWDFFAGDGDVKPDIAAIAE